MTAHTGMSEIPNLSGFEFNIFKTVVSEEQWVQGAKGDAVNYSSSLNPVANVKEFNGVAGFGRNRTRKIGHR